MCRANLDYGYLSDFGLLSGSKVMSEVRAVVFNQSERWIWAGKAPCVVVPFVKYATIAVRFGCIIFKYVFPAPADRLSLPGGRVTRCLVSVCVRQCGLPGYGFLLFHRNGSNGSLFPPR
jgi:hypothetical protein